jgi:predicted phage terminase large subunit-like protein
MSYLDRAKLRLAVQTDFLTFLPLCFSTLNPGAEFLPNWHIAAIAHRLELVRLGKIRRLIINLPPRSLKSIMCSVAFPAFLLGKEPTKRIIVASFSTELAVRLSNDFRAVIKSPWYQDCFPEMRISRSKDTESEIWTTKRGYRLAVSVDGNLIGRGADVIVVDDPLKPQDARSDKKRKRTNEWFCNSVLTRLDDKQNGVIIGVMQRLHPDDPTGMLLQSSDEWDVLRLPAIAEEEERSPIGNGQYHIRSAGDLLHPERETLFDHIKLRDALGLDYEAQYQQCPVPPDGNLIKREWVKRYRAAPARTSSTQVIQSWDTASKSGTQNSWSVCTTWYVLDDCYYLVEVARGRFDYPTLKQHATAQAERHRPTIILIEDAGVGTALLQELKKLGFPTDGVKAEHNKQTRMAIQADTFKAGQVILPEEAPWLRDLERELFSFPSSVHNDQIDSISQALAHRPIKGWTLDEKGLEGFSRLLNGLTFDVAFGRLAGRPW